VFDGNTGDPKTVMPQVDKMQDNFDIEEFILVGDRGVLVQRELENSSLKISNILNKKMRFVPLFY